MPASDATPAVLAICGGGNGAHALAAVASAHFNGDIVWLTSSEEKADRLRQGVFSAQGLRATGAVEATARRVRTVSADPAAVIPQSDLVVLVVPAFAHLPLLSRVAPYLKTGAWIVAMPSRSGFEFDLRAVATLKPDRRRVVIGFQTFPWLCRIREFGREVKVNATKATVSAAALPVAAAPAAMTAMSGIIGMEVAALPTFLDLTLGNTGQIIHPVGMYGLFGAWNDRVYAEEEIPAFYAGMDEETGRLLEAVSDEIVTVARALAVAAQGKLDLRGVLPIRTWLQTAYAHAIADASTLARAFSTNAAYRGVMAPMRQIAPDAYVPDFGHRFLTEDIPYGLVVTKAIAQIAGVATPHIDTVISWAQEKMGRQYLVHSALEGRDAHPLRIPQRYGITTIADLVAAYL